MEKLKHSDYSETETINGTEYKVSVLKVSDYEQVELSFELFNGSNNHKKLELTKRLLTRCAQIKVNDTWQQIGLGYFKDLIQAEYASLVRLMNRVNNIQPEDIDPEEMELLFDAMEMIGKLDFTVLDGLTKVQKDALRSHISKRKRNV